MFIVAINFDSIFFTYLSMQQGMGRSFTEGFVMQFWGNMLIFLLFVTPAVTMRLLAEEQKSGTIQLLYTSPVRIGEITIAKFLAGLLFVYAMLAITLIFPLLMSLFGGLNWTPIIGAYTGLAFVVGCFVSVGVFFSAVTENQIIAFILAEFTNLAFWLVAWIGQNTDVSIADIELSQVFEHLSVLLHYVEFARGIVETDRIIYLISFIGFWVFCTYLVLESKRWNSN
jgi:ABC-2 type transport system permease protein